MSHRLNQIFLHLLTQLVTIKSIGGFDKPIIEKVYELDEPEDVEFLREYLNKVDLENTQDFYIVNGTSPDLLKERVSKEDFIEYFNELL